MKIRMLTHRKTLTYKIIAILFWLFLWEFASRTVSQEILIASPISVVVTLGELIQTIDFWKTILFSSGRIVLGFSLSVLVGIGLAVIAYRNQFIYEIISPFMKVIKAAPVASFIILALLWIKSKNLSVLIAFLMVLPMIYSNILQGLIQTDKKLLEMARVFRISSFNKLQGIYIPSVKPYLFTAITVGLGFCWKAGIAAEVIGIPSGSIGIKLYQAKLYLMTKEVFAWTIVIIIISVVFEKLVILIIGNKNK